MSDYKWKPHTLLVSAEELDNKMKLEAGKYYKDSNGKKQGPMVLEPKGWFYVDRQLGCWDETGAADDSRTESDQGNLISEWSESPIREVTRRELVAGVYGRFEVTGTYQNKRVTMNFAPSSAGTSVPIVGIDAEELREAAHLFTQLAEYLESEGK